MGRCPHPDHNDETPSFVIKNTERGETWCCFGCHNGTKDLKSKHKNYGTDCFAFLQWMSDYEGSPHVLTFWEAVRELAKQAGIPMENDKYAKQYKRLGFLAEAYRYGLTVSQRKYLNERGIDDEDIEKWKIGGADVMIGGHSDYRIMFPLIGRYGRIYGFSARLHSWKKGDASPKYWNSPTSELFHKSSYLYGLQNLSEKCNEIRISEGVTDVILANKYSARNVVCTLGTAFTMDHVKLIQTLHKTPVFCLDGDEAGLAGAQRGISLLAKAGIFAKVCILPKGMDMAELALKEKEKLEDYIQHNTMLYWQFRLKDAASMFSSKIEDLRTQVLADIAEAEKGVTDTDKVLFNSYIYRTFGILCGQARPDVQKGA